MSDRQFQSKDPWSSGFDLEGYLEYQKRLVDQVAEAMAKAGI